MNSIDIFPWNENFNTNVEIIDAQHRKLVELLNRLAQGLLEQPTEAFLNDIFNELAEYTIYHFETEEKFWSKYLRNDPIDKEHQAIHQKFIDKMNELKTQQKTKQMTEIVEDALEFLANWLASHILETDRQMAYTVQAMEQGSTLEEAKAVAQQKMQDSSHVFIQIILNIYSTLSKSTLSLIKELKIHKQYDDASLYESNYRQLLLELSTSFINLPLEKLELEINTSLQKMAQFVGADRAYVFEYDSINATASNTHEWCETGITSEIDNLQNIPLDSMKGWFDTHQSGNYLLIQDTDQIQDNTTKEILLSQKIKSLVTFPMFRHDTCTGFVGFDAVKKLHTFTDGEITILHLFAKLLANVNHRRETEKSLARERNFFKTLIQTIPDLVWVKDIHGKYLECNTRFEEFFGVKETDIIGKTDFDFIDKELAELFRANDAIVINEKKPHTNEELVAFASDGHKELLSTTKVPMYGKNGNVIGVLGTSHDITKQKEVEKSLQLAASVFTHSNEGIIISSADNKIIDVNQAVTDISGYTKEELLGKNPNILSSGKNSPLFYKEMWESIQKNDYWSGEIWNRHKNGNLYAEMITISAVKDSNNNIINYLGLFSDITAIKRQQEHLEYIAHYDVLTGLPNRVLLSDRLKQAIAHAQRKNTSIAIVYLDLDGFKDINDTYGHDYGDILLSMVAQKMQDLLRSSDTISRIGGDEFIAVLPDLHTHEECVPLLQRLLATISQNITIKEKVVKVSASLGVTFYDSGDNTDPDQLLRHADQAMYQAKLAGKNRYHIFDPVKDATIRSHHKKLDSIERAFENNEFVLYYQPKVNMRLGKVLGFEALIRWNHPEDGILPPIKFLPIIENHPLSIQIGEWVLEEACKQLLQFKEQGLQLSVSVNISAMQLLKIDFSEKLATLMHRYPTITNGDLVIEILETSALEDLTHVSEIIAEAYKLGVHFSLDDFGTGYSSLTYLKKLSASQLKIDQSFVRDMLYDTDDLAIIQGVITLANAFHRGIIAEGVESIEHGVILIQLGCEIAQGYVIARPMPNEEITKWLEEYKVDSKWQTAKQVSTDKVSYIYAMTEHTGWLKKTLKALEQRDKSAIELNAKKCNFLLWIENQTDQASLLFHQIREKHDELHALASYYFSLEKVTPQEIDAQKEKITKKSEELMALLKTMSLS